MKTMSLKDFKEEKFPNMKGIEFSAMLGFNNSLISKILNGKYDCDPKSPKWQELVTHMRVYYEINLVPSSLYMAAIENKDNTIERLRYELRESEKRVEELEAIVVDLMKSIRICENARQAIEYGKFKLENYRRSK